MRRTKSTESELQEQWRQEAYMQQGPFKVGQLVEHAGEMARVRDCLGQNYHGRWEYFIEYCVPTKRGTYVTDRELTARKDLEPPELPKQVMGNVKGCLHERAYLNQISKSLSFWVCSDCKQEVSKSHSKGLTQEEIDELFEHFEDMLK